MSRVASRRRRVALALAVVEFVVLFLFAKKKNERFRTQNNLIDMSVCPRRSSGGLVPRPVLPLLIGVILDKPIQFDKVTHQNRKHD